MFTITIDNRPVEVSPEMTLLEAAEQAGIAIPTLCFYSSRRHGHDLGDGETLELTPASCQVCLVKANGRIVPSCATKVAEGMILECETPELVKLRRTAFELLLGDHVGDCEAPCRFACPTRLDIPQMLREIADNRFDLAIQTIWQSMPIPATLGRVCPRPCERVCRRAAMDKAVAICQLKRHVADTILGKMEIDPFAAVSQRLGKSVAVVGGGASGLCAAFHLASRGCDVSLFEREAECGGRFRLCDSEILPAEVLELEIEHLLNVGGDGRINTRLNESIDWNDPSVVAQMTQDYHAVLLAFGEATSRAWRDSIAIHDADRPERNADWANTKTYATDVPGVFAVGTALRGKCPHVRSAADGREAAESIISFILSGEPAATPLPFSVHIGRPDNDELATLGKFADDSIRYEPRNDGIDDYTPEQSQHQAARCLHCDCRGRQTCRLLNESKKINPKPARFSPQIRPRLSLERAGNIVFEPGKCIKCGLCVRIADQYGEQYGLTFVGRGFDVRVAVPFDHSLEEGLQRVGRLCVEVCPTGALTFVGGH